MHEADRSPHPTAQGQGEGQGKHGDQAEGLRRAMAARPAVLARRLAAQAVSAPQAVAVNALVRRCALQSGVTVSDLPGNAATSVPSAAPQSGAAAPSHRP